MNPFVVKLTGRILKITSNLEYPVQILEIILKYNITVNMIDDKVGLKAITDSVKVNKELRKNESLEIETKLEDISEVSIIYRDTMMVRRFDISL
ncbi:conserved hypothetical protein [Sulfolobus islandicus Y.G.57.14]|jgi:hypothetical protein|uniref:Uncharacterized protein n=9 Tax=Saccharolobus islandicus TaxID=43080 RepID=M9UEI9_SACIS|nr:hypothetical protein [Sulfolobus islandicus]ACP35433.1 conserved hypothetical protein [Sulfolobus islandicus L.S.2.15]ACP38092.1 conserved hypothetical protein [Sulfolobus islandicus M.14.25]ACP45599.1 conserved hypothetical protein [Sulfolobus islandicus Y.G.57.14]ACP48613.1 conserved hypothetical protein [Sulfolobus islandicus Y.N.15.51]ACP55271.1 conserved hypothetical protein [Sulfolobus islandicus M.16.27]